VLASASPRRSRLLADLGLDFVTCPVDIDETHRPGEEAGEYVLRLAREKAHAGAADDAVVIGADTIVTHGGRVLGKPTDESDATRMLASLAGRQHEVLTGVCVFDSSDSRSASGVERTEVTLGSMSPKELSWYTSTGEPLDKAGSYAIQGLGALFVDSVNGNYTNVVGLPLPLLFRLTAELGYDLKAFLLRT